MYKDMLARGCMHAKAWHKGTYACEGMARGCICMQGMARMHACAHAPLQVKLQHALPLAHGGQPKLQGLIHTVQHGIVEVACVHSTGHACSHWGGRCNMAQKAMRCAWPCIALLRSLAHAAQADHACILLGQLAQRGTQYHMGGWATAHGIFEVT